MIMIAMKEGNIERYDNSSSSLSLSSSVLNWIADDKDGLFADEEELHFDIISFIITRYPSSVINTSNNDEQQPTYRELMAARSSRGSKDGYMNDAVEAIVGSDHHGSDEKEEDEVMNRWWRTGDLPNHHIFLAYHPLSCATRQFAQPSHPLSHPIRSSLSSSLLSNNCGAPHMF